MKTIYMRKDFSKYRNDMVGDNGDYYKQLVLDPLMFGFLGDISEKVVLELGCGNGYLANKFLNKGVKKLILDDISNHNIDYAKMKCGNNIKVQFITSDIKLGLDIKDNSIDVVYSNMLLPHIDNLGIFFVEVYRVLKRGGILVFSTIHPSRMLRVYAKNNNNKILGVGNYFRRGRTKFLMGGDSEENITGERFKDEFEVENYQRPLEDYIEQIISAGFSIKMLKEPNVTKELIKRQPKFGEYVEHPVSLLIGCVK